MDDFSLFDSGSEPVAPVFFSDETGKPFTNCKLCNKELVESNSVYTIEKAYVRNVEKNENKLIFEFVYCNDCMEELRGSISKESMQRITAYFQSNSNIIERYEKFSKSNLFDADSWINNCIINNSDISEIEEYQLYCSCKGGNMLLILLPI
ncbi:MAG: hypothetical protein IPO21_17265 [Bacteroidales bacterium]|nr:hypothetical protein [Bacteroidales bacterium]